MVGVTHPLDDPVGLALRGLHAAYAVAAGSALRYHPEIGPFAALAPDPGPGDWADLAQLLGPDGGAALLDPPPLPPGWSVLGSYPALQMMGPALHGPGDEESAGPARSARPTTVAPATDAVRAPPGVSFEGNGARPAELHTEQDREDARDLAGRTEPGPFGPRTMELGTFLGVRDEGRLVAMAGERMHPTGWTEISGVCTDPSARGRGLSSTLVAAVAAGIEARGDRPYLHVLEGNRGATAVYARLGFTVRRTMPILVVRPPH